MTAAKETVARVEQELIIVRQENKGALLQSLLKEYLGSALVFSRTKHGAKKITRALNTAGFQAAEIHANRSLSQRRAALAGFKTGKFRILVATDIASRGIDVTDIEVVLNYDLPDDPLDYVHRIGRTGRAGRNGRAISFATPNQAQHIRDIEKLIRALLRRRVHASVSSPAVGQDAARVPHPRPHSGRPPSRGFHHPSTASSSSRTPPPFSGQSSGTRGAKRGGGSWRARRGSGGSGGSGSGHRGGSQGHHGSPRVSDRGSRRGSRQRRPRR